MHATKVCRQAKQDAPYTVWQSVEKEVHGGCCNSQQAKGSADANAQRRRAPTLAIKEMELHRLWERKNARHRRRAALSGLRILSCWWASEKHTASLVGTGREQMARSGVNTGHAWAQGQSLCPDVPGWCRLLSAPKVDNEVTLL